MLAASSLDFAGKAWRGAGGFHEHRVPVPLENTIRFGSRQVVRESGGMRVFVYQAVKDASSADPSRVEVGQGGAGRAAIAVRDLLFNALVGLAVL